MDEISLNHKKTNRINILMINFLYKCMHGSWVADACRCVVSLLQLLPRMKPFMVLPDRTTALNHKETTDLHLPTDFLMHACMPFCHSQPCCNHSPNHEAAPCLDPADGVRGVPHQHAAVATAASRHAEVVRLWPFLLEYQTYCKIAPLESV